MWCLRCLVDNTNVNSDVFLGGAGPADNQAAIFQIRSATEIWTTVHAAAAYGFSCASTLALCVLDSCRCRPHVAGNSDGRRGSRGRPPQQGAHRGVARNRTLGESVVGRWRVRDAHCVGRSRRDLWATDSAEGPFVAIRSGNDGSSSARLIPPALTAMASRGPDLRPGEARRDLRRFMRYPAFGDEARSIPTYTARGVRFSSQSISSSAKVRLRE